MGLIVTVLLARYGIGLSSNRIKAKFVVKEECISHCEIANHVEEKIDLRKLVRALFPLWGTILLLVITRVPQFGIKDLLLLSEPFWSISLGSLGVLSISPALVISLNNIFNTSESWSHSLLYIPSIIPFGVVALLAFWINSGAKCSIKKTSIETIDQMRRPMLALLGALVFVNLMMMGDGGSAVERIGAHLATVTGSSWQFFAAYLGALGSFFSGSNTISNLTFAGIQDSIAIGLGLNRTTILALQSAGGAMGNMVCINNIVAVASVLALSNKEGYILKRTIVAMLVYGIVIGVVSFLF